MIRRAPSMPPPPLCRDIFSMGACVRVDPSTTSQGGIGFVSAVHTEERKVDIDYIVNSIGIVNSSPFIDEGRLHPHVDGLHPHVYAPSNDSTTRSGRCRRIQFGEGAATEVVKPPPLTVKKKNRLKNIYDTLADSRTWLPSAGPLPVVKHPKKG